MSARLVEAKVSHCAGHQDSRLQCNASLLEQVLNYVVACQRPFVQK